MKITFVTNADGVTKAPVTADYNVSFDLSGEDYILENYNDKKFGGWFLDEEFSNACNASCRFTADTTVYAKWLEKITVTIVYSDG